MYSPMVYSVSQEFDTTFDIRILFLHTFESNKGYTVYLCIVSLFVAIPSPPIGLNAENVTCTSASILWQQPHDAQGFITHYQISFTKPDGSEQHHQVKNTTSTVLASLEPHTKYTIRVRAKLVQFGDYSTFITISTLGKKEIFINFVKSIAKY